MILNVMHQNIKQIANLEKSYLLRLIISGIGALFLCWFSCLSQFGKPHAFSHELYYWAGLTLTTPILYFAGLPFLRALSHIHKTPFSIDILIIVVLLVIYAYSLINTLNYQDNNAAYFDSILMILFIVLSCRFLALFCLRRIKNSVNLLSKLPTKGVKILKADEQFHACELHEITKGDRITIAPGEYFPVDGIIQEGDTNVDESMLSGEAHCVAKFVHDKVRAGTYNLDKAVIICASTTFADSYFGNLLFSIQINHQKMTSQPPCDQIGLWQQMLMVTLCAIIYCWWLPFDSHVALNCAMSVLLITCPCAIASAFPITTACLLEICAKKGILITNPLAFYRLTDVEHMLFDKTGTLTEGNLVVQTIDYFNEASPEAVLPFIGAIEKNTHHPIADAIVDYTIHELGTLPHIEVHRLHVFPGCGVRAMIDAQCVMIGTAKWLKANGIYINTDLLEQEENVNNDKIYVHCAMSGILVARILLKDKLRQEAKDVVGFLRLRNMELSVLSGDRPHIVNAIASQLGEITANSQVLPCQKEAMITSLQDNGVITCMVGDGLNDAQALMRADIGIAIGTKNPIALACADIILPTSRLKLIPDCFRLCIEARKILKQNYWLGFLFNLILIPFAALSQLSPLLILSALCFSTLLVMANSARLKFKATTL